MDGPVAPGKTVPLVTPLPPSSPMPRPLWWIHWVNHHTCLESLLGGLTSHLLGFASSALAQRLWGFSEGDLCLPSVCLLQWLLISNPWASDAREVGSPTLGSCSWALSLLPLWYLCSHPVLCSVLYRCPLQRPPQPALHPSLTTTLHIQGPRAPSLTPTKAHWVTS